MGVWIFEIAVLMLGMTWSTAQAADSSTQFARFQEVCAESRNDLRMGGVLGCIALQDPETARREISMVATRACVGLNRQCASAGANHRARLASIADRMSCGSSASACGGSGAVTTAQFDLCDGKLRIRQFRALPNGSYFLQLESATGSVHTTNLTRQALFDSPSSAELRLSQSGNGTSREERTANALEPYVRNSVNDNCEALLAPSPGPSPSWIDYIGGSIRRYVNDLLLCRRDDQECLAKVKKQRDVGPGIRG